jgi:hypothetical protein
MHNEEKKNTNVTTTTRPLIPILQYLQINKEKNLLINEYVE